MKLDTYLKETKTPVPAFAEEIGVCRQTVYCWINGDKFPGPENIAKVKSATKGAVTADDLLT